MRKWIVTLAVIAIALPQLACAASANIGSPTPAPTPVPTPAPQIIYVQPPAQATQAMQPDPLLLLVLIVVLVAAMMLGAYAIAKIVVSSHQAVQSQPPASNAPQSLTLNTYNYYNQQLPVAQLTEAEHFKVLRAQGYTPEAALVLMTEQRRAQIAPPKE